MNPDWHFGINDPEPVGWLIFSAYLLVAALCWMCARKSTQSSCRKSVSDPFLWWCLAALMLLFGINKQLDLQTPFIALGRSMAIAEGWYAWRRIVQWTFIGCIGLSGATFLAWTGWHARRRLLRYMLPFAGVAILVVFVLLEAAPVHPSGADGPVIVDRQQILEMVGIACIGLSAIMNLWRSKTAKSSIEDAS